MIEDLIPAIVTDLRSHPALVLVAPPGAGKTTRVPPALYQAGFAASGEIIVLEPRRIAARLAAARVASELNQKIGETVGYSIRYETVGGRRTRIRFVTEAILTRRLISDPSLKDISVVILDEFHERSLHTDMALALLRRLQLTTRPDLRLLVMSATIDAAPVARFLGGAPVVAGADIPYPVEIEFATRPSDRPLHEEVALAVQRALRAGPAGDILVFLPGAAEIRQASDRLASCAGKEALLIAPLHGDLPFAAQIHAVQPALQRKAILATNVAESSVTIPGVGMVIDSGLARAAGYSAWSGLPRLSLAKISKASAAQRAGRAGRTREGRVIRLYTRHDFETRREYDRPEIQRLDLSEATLILHGLGIANPQQLQWLDPPPQDAVDGAEALLRRLGATDSHGRLSAAGKEMLRFPVHPRLSRLIVEGERLGIRRRACLAAALLSERDIRQAARAELHKPSGAQGARHSAQSDLNELIELFEGAQHADTDGAAVVRLGLDARAVESVDRHCRHLEQVLRARPSPEPAVPDQGQALRTAVLAAFPDRVAKRRRQGSFELLLESGGTARLSEASVVRDAPLLVVLDVEERTGRRGSLHTESVVVRLASAIEAEWLAELFPGELSEKRELVWNEGALRVDEIVRTAFGRLTLDEKSRAAPASAETSALLAEAIIGRQLRDFDGRKELASLQARLELIARYWPERPSHLTCMQALVGSVLADACVGRRSIAELRDVSLAKNVQARMNPDLRRLLERETPERIALPKGSRPKVHYESGQPPWVESRLQDFFGMTSTPSICAGRLPLTVRLLAPSMRPVQVTQDLASFWKVHYPELRVQLQRRYPRHAWPEPDSQPLGKKK